MPRLYTDAASHTNSGINTRENATAESISSRGTSVKALRKGITNGEKNGTCESTRTAKPSGLVGTANIAV